LELYEKIYVNPSFLDSDHGRIACEECHGGNPEDPNWQTAHQGVVQDPSFPDPGPACGQCHEEISAGAQHSLHYTLGPMYAAIEQRTSVSKPEVMNIVRQASERHCGTCHASCGQCHISRPAYVNGGFLSGHNVSNPPMETVCAGCHGGRVVGEYTGAKEDYAADVHYSKGRMACTKCHSADELHADGRGTANRFQENHTPECRSCHAVATEDGDTNPFHARHAENLACQVCHAQANKNCFICHVGTDPQGLPYFKCKDTRMLFKIGRNPQKSARRPYDYAVLRHAPVAPELFDAYVKGALDNFSVQPTWKLDAPHSIQRRTPQNRSCNACHGHGELFLGVNDMADWERDANSRVIVPLINIPQPVKEDLK
jgi:hypothetical protein